MTLIKKRWCKPVIEIRRSCLVVCQDAATFVREGMRWPPEYIDQAVVGEGNVIGGNELGYVFNFSIPLAAVYWAMRSLYVIMWSTCIAVGDPDRDNSADDIENIAMTWANCLTISPFFMSFFAVYMHAITVIPRCDWALVWRNNFRLILFKQRH